MSIHEVVHCYLVMGLFGRRKGCGAEEQWSRNRIIEIQGQAKILGTLRGVFIGIGGWVKGEVAEPVSQVYVGPVDLYLDLPKAAIPLFIRWIIAESVIGGAVVDALADCFVEFVYVVKSAAAGDFRNIIHRGMRVYLLGAFGTHRLVQSTARHPSTKAVSGRRFGFERGKIGRAHV